MESIIVYMKDALKELYDMYLFRFLNEKDISKDDWDMFSENIETHKYWLNENYEHEISLSASFNDWLEYTFDPFFQAVIRYKILDYIEMNIIMLYRIMMTDWHHAKESNHKSNNIYIHHIVRDFCLRIPQYPSYKKLIIRLER